MFGDNKGLFYFNNKTRGTTIAHEARLAETFLTRLKGLLGTDGLADGAGLFISPCQSIHMFGMKYAIDVIFVDRELVVVGILNGIKPGRASRVYNRARSCLELPVGAIERSNTQVGDQLEYGPVSN